MATMFLRSSITQAARRFAAYALVASFIMLWPTHAANAQEVSVALSSKRTWVGVPVQVVFSVENATDIGDPTLPTVPGLDIQYSGSVSQRSSISIINGVRRESRSVDIAVEVTPEQAGSFTIPSIQIKVDGKPFASEPISFSAIAAENNDRVFAQIVGSDRPVYVGEPVELVLQIWIKPFESDQYDLTVNEETMWQLVDFQQSKWGPFSESLVELARERRRPAGRTVQRDEGEYYLYEIKREIRPTGLGEIEDLSDVVVGVSYPTGVERTRSIFRSNLQFTGLMPLRARASVENINVQPLPTEGQPKYFQGAVGNFIVRAAAQPTDVAVGDPITVTFLVGSVDGEGAVLDTLRPPPLGEMSELTKDFRIPQEPIAGTVEGNIKIFTQSFRPRWDNITEIPPIPFSFFDPETEEYRTIYTDAIPVEVSPAEQLASSDIVRSNKSDGAALATTPEDNLDSSELDETLRANFPVTPSMLASSSRTLGVTTPAILALPPACFAAIGLLVARRRWKDAHPALIRSRNARKRAHTSIRNSQDLASIGQAVRGFVSDRAGRSATSVTATEATKLARAAGADAPLLVAMDELLRKTERAGYGATQEDPTQAGDEALRIVNELNRCGWKQPEEGTQ